MAERAPRVKLSKEWTNKAQISEYIKLMVDNEESSDEEDSDSEIVWRSGTDREIHDRWRHERGFSECLKKLAEE